MDTSQDKTASFSRPTEDDAAFADFRGSIVGGKYKILDILGEGGFGTVWAAEQRDPVKRRVAIKIIKLGMDTKQVIARFEAERQALAMMDHPNIAKVFDAGTTDTGRPFFVMELVRGVPIQKYCDTEKLDTRARLKLFKQVCHAIQHAHQKGIIHRDIKPSNVLVTLHDGVPVPKVIDFGIAKAMNQELTEKTIYTQQQQVIGTPVYISPEQVEMSVLGIDTRSDIYSLGVLLYELLTGTTPITLEELNSAGYDGMMRLIREVEPHKPSTRLSSLGETATRMAQLRRSDVQKLGMIFRGDLDWIVMKCLEKDRTRRYDTANGLAADIQRHLSDQPVLAGPPSTRYKLQKFVKRNRAQVIAGSVVAAVLVLGVIGTSGGMIWALNEKSRAADAAESERVARIQSQENELKAIAQAKRAEAAEADATARSEELRLVAEFQSEQLSAIEPHVMGFRLRRAILDAVPQAGSETFRDVMSPVNFTNIALAMLEENIFKPAVDVIETQFKSQPLVRARLLQSVARTLRGLGLLGIATDPQETALAIRRAELGDEHPDTLTSVAGMGALLHAQGKLAEAEPYYQEALATRRRVLGDEHPDTIASISDMGYLFAFQGRLSDAEPYYREALDRGRRVLGDEHPDTLEYMNNMGFLLQVLGKRAEAEVYSREAMESRRRVLGDEHPGTLTSLSNLGVVIQNQGRLREAEPYLRESAETRRRVLGDEHPDTLVAAFNVAALLQAQGRLAEAELLYREGLEIEYKILGDDHPDTLISIGRVGALLKSKGKLAEAEPYLRQALESRRRVMGSEHPRTMNSISNMGLWYKAQGKLAEAEPYLRQALEMRRRVLGNEHPHTLDSVSNLGSLHRARGKSNEAEVYWRDALEGRRRVLGERHRDTVISIRNFSILLIELGRADEALHFSEELVQIATKAIREADRYINNPNGKRNYALRMLDQYNDAESSLLAAHDILIQSLGPRHEQTRRVLRYLVDLYEAWNDVEPGAEHDMTAAEWRNRLATSQ